MRRSASVLLLIAITALLAGTVRAGSADVRGTLGNGWVRYTIDGPKSQSSVEYMVAAGPGLVAVGQGPVGNAVWTSSDGRTWKRRDGAAAYTYVRSLHVDAPLLSRMYSQVYPGTANGYIYSARHIGPNGQYIGVGDIQPSGKPVTDWRAAVWISTDGMSWKLVTNKSKAFVGTMMMDVERGGPGWIAVGGRSPGPEGPPIEWTSPDAVHWTRAARQPPASPLGGAMTMLVRGPDRLVAIGGTEGRLFGSTTWTSTDGLDWRLMAGNPFPQTGGITALTTGGPGYVAVGQRDASPALWTSPDGLTWQRVAGAPSFPGDFTRLIGVASLGQVLVVVGAYAPGGAKRVPSAWVWTPASSQAGPTPIPRMAALNPKSWSVRLDDLPDGYINLQSAPVDLCDDGATQCIDVARAIGKYRPWEVEYEGSGPGKPVTEIWDMSLEGTHGRSHALKTLGIRLVRWWDRFGKVTQLSSDVRIGQETQLFRWPTMVGGSQKGVAYAVNWRDGKAIGSVYVSRSGGQRNVTRQLALDLARVQWQRRRAAAE